MAQMFGKAVMTEAGIELLNKAQLGTAKIAFTNMRTGNGSYTEEEKEEPALRARTGLKSFKNKYTFNGVEQSEADTIKLRALLSNCDATGATTLVSTGYYITEIAIYAKDSSTEDAAEIMYAIAVSADEEHADYMLAYTGENRIEIIQEWYARIDNAKDVMVEVTGQYASAEDMEQAQADIVKLQSYDDVLTDSVNSYHQESVESVDNLDVRLSLLELMISTEVEGNPFTVTFKTLDDISVEGVWNETSRRIEF